MPYLWKTLENGLKSKNGEVTWVRGEWQTITGPLVLCWHGFHASPRIIDAMRYVAPAVITQVEVRGDHLDDGDKQCWAEMRVVEVYPWSALDSVALAIYAAELVIELYESQYPSDQRPRDAIEAAKAYLKKPSAGAAAEAAAWAAEAAARAAAWAAEAAARAVGAAGAAARAEKILDYCEAFIQERLGLTSRRDG